MGHKVLIIEDNLDIARLVQSHLADIGCTADLAHDGAAGLTRYEQGEYELVILDLMLPVLDGLEVCRAMRAMPGYVPIIMLTAKSTELDRVLGLEIGADDYITKPFSIPELMARIKAAFRRSEALSKGNSEQAAPTRLQRGGLDLDVESHQVQVEGRSVDLTAKEFDLLLHFARHPGRVYTRTQLLDQVWGYNHEGYEHTVNSHINRLRAKIEKNPSDPHYILTIWGVGYKFAEPG